MDNNSLLYSLRSWRPAGDASPRHRESGFTLVEVLVSIVVLSFGILGLVGVQAFALQSTREARLQAQAANLAREMAEMMRGNNQIGIKSDASLNPYLVSLQSPLAPATAGYCLGVASSSACADGTAVARAELTDWLTRLDAALPGARVVICFDKAPYDSNGMPQWNCTAGTAGVDEIAVIKIGWTRKSTLRASESAGIETAAASTSYPYVVFPVTSGNPMGAPSL
ncbi:type IV pilus modification protein PilV [Paracidovorax cattleyae]|uniref:Type IV pilus assembly protein PilV n=1 Tax=Paracidovorax cattleyae TaxID=80868 RepID=A0A1H0LI61_9BURK|nr:type IV pilus modification protein PilV [Paracidovorax cattleyae]AVS75235.1 type IV pilus modification protein PilV [Paracidovorax cattleyae]MBF9264764.1 type IV pilus modification protein PilV [Paracidovorax cattleyae]SDO67755.1 type IV pilus assembly protein PilV [Paracidovorax cattleyae]